MSTANERAGVGPQDMSLAEVHDASAFAEVVQVENLGFCEFRPRRAHSGQSLRRSRIEGPSDRGHRAGQIYELVTQLRGEAGKRQVEGARFAIAENVGGFHGFEEAAACAT